ncbi:MAG TPA: 4-alpha-glucanotransferase [Gemmatimonadaceae bacterium]|nr:4-alpha-glucanotransferase [Gemmatimonadaceae bacterium]
MATKSRVSALRRLADAVGIIPKYLDQTGTEWRETSAESRAALLAAMGFDATREAAAESALRALRLAERRELIAPVHVVEQNDDSAVRRLDARLASPPNATARWRLELKLESGDQRTVDGVWPSGRFAELSIPWPDYPAIGYHQLRLTVDTGRRSSTAEQTLIVVPSRCVLPRDLLDERRAFGLVANLYTVRSEQNWGVGDVSDLRRLIDWTGSLGGAFVGVNPLHALANMGEGISPYSPVSRLFRNPIYIDIEAIPELHEAPNVAQRLDHPEFEAELEALRDVPHVQYEQVMALKMPMLEELHRVFVRSRTRVAAYDEYVRENDPELTGFATFVTIAENRGSWNWREWPSPLRDSSSEAVKEIQRAHSERIDLHRWIQFELDQQLGEVASTARRAKLPIGLYQDLAIGTSPGGADSWFTPQLFVQGASIGAPPDPYSATGQKWGLPPIDARALRRDRYRYFIRLVQSGFRHAGALRIDHVMGLFRLFWIPEGKTGKEGAYVRSPSDDLLGILALESVKQNALVVGEDLGTVPKEIPPALEKWGILSSKVLYFERDRRGAFRSSEQYPPLALATANTHDMATLAGFWRGQDIEDRARVGLIESREAKAAALADRQRDKGALVARLTREGTLVRGQEGVGNGVPEPNDVELRAAVHEFLCKTPAALVGISLDDLAGELDAVNVPGVGPDKHSSWTRKMSMTLEQIQASSEVRRALRCPGRSSSSD